MPGMGIGNGIRVEPALPGFNPAFLFNGGGVGVWYDPSDLSTMFQDSAGTIAVTAPGQPVGLIKDKSGNNNHASQANNGQRPTYNVDSNGSSYLQFDGSDDVFVTINPINLEIGMSAFAISNAGSGIGLGTLVSQGSAGYLGVQQTANSYIKNDGGTNYPVLTLKTRQAITLMSSNSGRTVNGFDSVGNTGNATAASNGLNAINTIGRFTPSVSAPLLGRLHQIILFSGNVSLENQYNTRVWLASKLIAVTP